VALSACDRPTTTVVTPAAVVAVPGPAGTIVLPLADLMFDTAVALIGTSSSSSKIQPSRSIAEADVFRTSTHSQRFGSPPGLCITSVN